METADLSAPLRSLEKRFQERSAELQIPRLRSGFVTFFSSGVVLRPESSQEHLPTSIAGVLRLRAIKPSVCDRSAKRFAQDDGFFGGLEIQLVGCRKHLKIEKVTGSRDDKGEGNGFIGSGAESRRFRNHFP
jgi:hypothetical protein